MALGIWNNLDELALYLGLSRLDGETNDELADRIKIFPRWKYRTDYYTQVHSIPLQLGLNTDVIGRITNVNKNKYVCEINWDYFILYEVLEDGSKGEYIRVFLETKDDTVEKIFNVINSSTAFTCIIYNESDKQTKLSFLIRNRNIKIETTEINGRYAYLGKKEIVKDSIRVNSKSYRRLVESIDKLKVPGDYFIDYTNGYVQTLDTIPDAATITFSYYDPTFALEKTELNLIPVNRLFSYGMTDEAINTIPFILNNIVAGE